MHETRTPTVVVLSSYSFDNSSHNRILECFQDRFIRVRIVCFPNEEYLMISNIVCLLLLCDGNVESFPCFSEGSSRIGLLP